MSREKIYNELNPFRESHKKISRKLKEKKIRLQNVESRSARVSRTFVNDHENIFSYDCDPRVFIFVYINVVSLARLILSRLTQLRDRTIT